MRRTAIAAAAALLLSAVLSPVSGDPRYDNTFMKDFIMDAPWRVRSADTAIPLTIILKDCDTDDIRELHWIRCWDVTSGETLIWGHDFGDEQIGDDAYESNYWTYVTSVTEGHPSLPDGTQLTAASLGYGPGDSIDLKISIYYRDDWFNYTETRYLRVSVAHADYPWPGGWYGGDVHYHTMYTNNIAEFGSPLPAVVMAAEAMGLHWVTVTDHSCDLDETGDGSFSYATTHWEYTVQDESGSQTVYRDNTAFGTTWGALGDDVGVLDSPACRLYRGVELNSASVDADSYQKTLHSLFYNESYISSPLSGAIGERPVTPPLPEALSQLAGGGFAYSAHPMSDMSAEWGGIDWTVNGAAWGDEDFATALGFEAYRGLQAFNTRPTRYSTDQNNPWPDFDAGVVPENPYPNELLAGISEWDAQLRSALSPIRKIFIAGGSDAHGDFNYASHLSLDTYATDNAMGKVQTVVFVPGEGYGPDNLPPMSDVLTAYRKGRSVVTDGPFVEIGVDRNGDGDFDDVGDLLPGGDTEAQSVESTPLTVRWRSTTDFGQVVSLELLEGSPGGMTTLLALDPSASGEGFGGERVVELGGLGLSGVHYFRAECRTDRGDDQFRAYVNPVWISFDAASVADGAAVSAPKLSLGSNPFAGKATLSVTLPRPGPTGLAVYDIAGRLVRRLRATEAGESTAVLEWDGLDESGRPAAAGLYLFRLNSRDGSALTKGVLLR